MSKILDRIFTKADNGEDAVDWEYVESIPEFAALKEAQQSPKWHGEGNVWNHTQNVVDEALKICKERRWGRDNEPTFFNALVGAALFHDIGKGVSTFQGKDGRWHSYGHEETGEKITRRLLWDEDIEIREKICKLVKLHMKPLMIYDNKHFTEELIKLIYDVKMVSGYNAFVPFMFELLVYLKQCDLRGSIFDDEERKKSDTGKLNKLESIAYSSLNRLYLHDMMNLLNKMKPYNIPNVYMLFGLPGAGKDTYIKGLFEKITENPVVLCRDDIRVELGYCNEGEKIVGTKEQEENVTNIFNMRLTEAVRNGKSVIINNINLKKKYRDSVKELLKSYDVWYEYVYVGADSLQKNIERRKGQIDENIFKGMISALDWPDAFEYDGLTFSIN